MSDDPYRSKSDPPLSVPQDYSQSVPPSIAAGQPRGCAVTASQVVAAIVATIFVLVTPLVMFAFNAERIALNPGTYKQALNRMDFYNRIPALMSAELAESIRNNPEGNQSLASLSKSDLQAIVTGLVPQGWAQQQTESAIDQIFAWLDSDQEQLKVEISMTEVKKQLAGPEGTSALLKVMNSWPACTDAQVAEAALKTQLGDLSDLPECNPPDSLKSEVTAYFGEVTANGAASIPDTIDLAAPGGNTANITPANDPRPRLKLFRSLALFSPILPALLLLAIAGLAIRSWKSLSRWWGIPLIVAAILAGLMALLMLPLRDMVTQAVAGQGPGMLAVSLEDVVTGMAGYVLQTMGWWIGGEAAVMGGAGVILFISGFFGGQSQKPAPISY